LSLTIIVGQPGAGKSKTIRERYLRVSQEAIFFDGHHSEEKVRQLRHEMGFFSHRYLHCTTSNLWPELERLGGEKEVFIDMPDLTPSALEEIQNVAQQKDWHITITARTVPLGLTNAEFVQL